SGAWHERLARGRQLDPSRGSVEELRADARLELPDSPAQRRDRDVEANGGPCEAQLFGDDEECTQVLDGDADEGAARAAERLGIRIGHSTIMPLTVRIP